MDFLKQILNRCIYKPNLLTIFILLVYAAIYPLYNNANPLWFEEHNLIENTQLVILALSFAIAITAKSDRSLYITAAMIIILMMMRETNMGRSYFCDHFLDTGEMCKWSNLKYGYIAEIIRAVYSIAIIVYAWKNRLHLIALRYLKDAPLYLLDLSLLVISAAVACVAEKPFENEILEEIAETLFYLSMLNCLWQYIRNDNGGCRKQ